VQAAAVVLLVVVVVIPLAAGAQRYGGLPGLLSDPAGPHDPKPLIADVLGPWAQLAGFGMVVAAFAGHGGLDLVPLGGATLALFHAFRRGSRLPCPARIALVATAVPVIAFCVAFLTPAGQLVAAWLAD
jgi:hypothetical protein